MTSNYEQAAREACIAAKLKSSYSDIANFHPARYWLSELYQHMALRKEITELRDLDDERKRKYWEAACEIAWDKKRGERIILCQAFYMHDLIKEKI